MAIIAIMLVPRFGSLKALLTIALAMVVCSCDKTYSTKGDAPTGPINPKALESGQVHAITAAQYDSLIRDANRLVVVDFHASWCPPCKLLGPIMEQMAGEFSKDVLFLKVDVDENRVLTTNLGVKSVPDVRLFRDGMQVHHSIGLLTSEEIRSTIKAYLPPPEVVAPVAETTAKPRLTSPEPEPAKPSLLDRLKQALPGSTPPTESSANPTPPTATTGNGDSEGEQPIRPIQPNENWMPPGMGKGAAPPPAKD